MGETKKSEYAKNNKTTISKLLHFISSGPKV